MDDLRHPNCRKCVLDVTSDEQVNSVVSKLIEDEGHIDLLINNAGMPAAGLFHPPHESRIHLLLLARIADGLYSWACYRSIDRLDH